MSSIQSPISPNSPTSIGEQSSGGRQGSSVIKLLFENLHDFEACFPPAPAQPGAAAVVAKPPTGAAASVIEPPPNHQWLAVHILLSYQENTADDGSLFGNPCLTIVSGEESVVPATQQQPSPVGRVFAWRCHLRQLVQLESRSINDLWLYVNGVSAPDVTTSVATTAVMAAGQRGNVVPVQMPVMKLRRVLTQTRRKNTSVVDDFLSVLCSQLLNNSRQGLGTHLVRPVIGAASVQDLDGQCAEYARDFDVVPAPPAQQQQQQQAPPPLQPPTMPQLFAYQWKRVDFNMMLKQERWSRECKLALLPSSRYGQINGLQATTSASAHDYVRSFKQWCHFYGVQSSALVEHLQWVIEQLILPSRVLDMGVLFSAMGGADTSAKLAKPVVNALLMALEGDQHFDTLIIKDLPSAFKLNKHQSWLVSLTRALTRNSTLVSVAVNQEAGLPKEFLTWLGRMWTLTASLGLPSNRPLAARQWTSFEWCTAVDVVSLQALHQACQQAGAYSWTTIRLAHASLTKKHMPVLAQLLANFKDNLAVLDLSYNSFGMEGLSSLSTQFLGQPNAVRTLVLAHCSLTQVEVLFQQLSRGCTQLAQLDLASNRFGTEGADGLSMVAQQLEQYFAQCRVTYLDLSSTRMPTLFLEGVLAGLVQRDRVSLPAQAQVTLKFADNAWQAMEARVMSQYLPQNKVQNLVLDGNTFGQASEGWVHLLPVLAQHSTLQSLSLSRCFQWAKSISSTSIDLAQLVWASGLTSLVLTQNHLKLDHTRRLFDHLCNAGANSRLTTLDLSGNLLGDKAVVPICRVLQCHPTLKEMGIHHNNLSWNAWMVVQRALALAPKRRRVMPLPLDEWSSLAKSDLQRQQQMGFLATGLQGMSGKWRRTVVVDMTGAAAAALSPLSISSSSAPASPMTMAGSLTSVQRDMLEQLASNVKSNLLGMRSQLALGSAEFSAESVAPLMKRAEQAIDECQRLPLLVEQAVTAVEMARADEATQLKNKFTEFARGVHDLTDVRWAALKQALSERLQKGAPSLFVAWPDPRAKNTSLTSQALLKPLEPLTQHVDSSSGALYLELVETVKASLVERARQVLSGVSAELDTVLSRKAGGGSAVPTTSNDQQEPASPQMDSVFSGMDEFATAQPLNHPTKDRVKIRNPQQRPASIRRPSTAGAPAIIQPVIVDMQSSAMPAAPPRSTSRDKLARAEDATKGNSSSAGNVAANAGASIKKFFNKIGRSSEALNKDSGSASTSAPAAPTASTSLSPPPPASRTAPLSSGQDDYEDAKVLSPMAVEDDRSPPLVHNEPIDNRLKFGVKLPFGGADMPLIGQVKLRPVSAEMTEFASEEHDRPQPIMPPTAVADPKVVLKRRQSTALDGTGDYDEKSREFTAWLGKQFSAHGQKLKSVELFAEYFKDGATMLEVLEWLSTTAGAEMPKYRKNPTMPAHRMDNTNIFLGQCSKLGVSMGAKITAEELINGEPKKIMILMSALIKQFP